MHFYLAAIAYEYHKDVQETLNFLESIPPENRFYDRALRLRIQLLLHPALELVVIRCTVLLFAGAPEHHGQFQADGDQQKGVKSCQIFHGWFSPIIKIRVPQKAGPGVFYSNS